MLNRLSGVQAGRMPALAGMTDGFESKARDAGVANRA
jgi:hypothetical protein